MKKKRGKDKFNYNLVIIILVICLVLILAIGILSNYLKTQKEKTSGKGELPSGGIFPQSGGGGGGASNCQIASESVPLFSGNVGLYPNDLISKVRNTIDSNDLPNLLVPGSFLGNVNTIYNQYINLRYSGSRIVFANQPTQSDNPVYGVSHNINPSNYYIYSTSVNFNSPVDFTDSNSKTRQIVLFGKDYLIAPETDDSKLVLLDSSKKFSFDSTGTTTGEFVGGNLTYTIELINVDSSGNAEIQVTTEDGTSASDTIAKGNTGKINGVTITVVSSYSGNQDYSASIIAGVSMELSSTDSENHFINIYGQTYTIELVNVDSSGNTDIKVTTEDGTSAEDTIAKGDSMVINGVTIGVVNAHSSNQDYSASIIAGVSMELSSADFKNSFSVGNSKYTIELINVDSSGNAEIQVTTEDGTSASDTIARGNTGKINGLSISVISATSNNQKYTASLIVSSDNDKLSLFTIPGYPVDINGNLYFIELLNVDSSKNSEIEVTSEDGTSATDTIAQGSSRNINGISIGVISAKSNNFGYSAEINIEGQRDINIIGNLGSFVTKGSSLTPIDGTNVMLDGGTTANTKITINVFAKDSDNDALLPGQSFTDPVFGTFRLDFSAGMNIGDNDYSREKLQVIRSADDKVQIKGLLKDTYGNDVSFQFAKNWTNGKLELQSGDSGKNITVMEGQATYRGEYMVVGNEDTGRLLKVYSIVNSSSGYWDDKVTFQDVATGETIDTVITSEGHGMVSIAGKSYNVDYYAPISQSSDLYYITVVGTDAGTTRAVYPTIESQNGAKVAFYEPELIDMSSITGLRIPNGNGFETITWTGNIIYNVWGGTLNTNMGDGASSATMNFGQFVYNLTSVGIPNKAMLYVMNGSAPLGGGGGGGGGGGLSDEDSLSNIVNPALIITENKDGYGEYNSMLVTLKPGATSVNGLGVEDVIRTWGNDHSWKNNVDPSNSNLVKQADSYGVITTIDSTTNQKSAIISIPPEQVKANLYISDDNVCSNNKLVSKCSSLSNDTISNISRIQTFPINNKITLKEGDPTYNHNYLVLPWDGGVILKVQNIFNTTGFTNDIVEFEDFSTGDVYDTTITSEGKGIVSIYGRDHQVNYYADTSGSPSNYYVTLSWYPDNETDTFYNCAGNIECYRDSDCGEDSTNYHCVNDSYSCSSLNQYFCTFPGTPSSICGFAGGGGCGPCSDGCNNITGQCNHCGDSICSNGETCSTCPQDCGICVSNSLCNQKQISNDDARDIAPISWGEDNSRLYFLSYDNQTGWNFYGRNIDLSNLKKEANINSVDALLSPMGDKIAYSIFSDTQPGLFIMDLGGNVSTKLYNDGSAPSWSNDGKTIFFVRNVGNQDKIVKINLDGTNFTSLSQNGDDEYNPSANPITNEIVFFKVINGTTSLWIMDSNGNNKRKVIDYPIQMPNGGRDTIKPAWTSDGNTISFSVSSGGSGKSGIWMVNKDGTDSRFLIKAKDSFPFIWYSSASFSSDGEKIAFEKTDYTINSGSGDVYPKIWIADTSPCCGDNICNNGETCTTCPQDCGSCGDTGGNPGGSSGGGSSPAVNPKTNPTKTIQKNIPKNNSVTNPPPVTNPNENPVETKTNNNWIYFVIAIIIVIAIGVLLYLKIKKR